jgi:predicted transcriptional regulator
MNTFHTNEKKNTKTFPVKFFKLLSRLETNLSISAESESILHEDRISSSLEEL